MTQAILKTDATALPKQPWLASVKWDCALIIGPAIVTSVIALACKPILDNSQFMPLWAWVTFVLVVDVAHVYSTLFRTYFDRRSIAEHHLLLVVIPIACWFAGWLLYRTDDMYFWRALAYLAVFHFIRQQFGFVALYSRNDPREFLKVRWLDQLCVYTVTLYPLLYWHTHLPRNFNWFVSGDFVNAVPHVVNECALAFYCLVITVYTAKELLLFKSTGFLNIPKNLILFGTALSWWVGIVALNSDLAFTMTNVVSHGVPYMALIWLYHNKASRANANVSSAETRASKSLGLLSKDFLLSFAPAFVLFLVLLAYFEEGFWDGLIWREHLTFFTPFASLPAITDATTLSILVPLLSLPQSTHYVLDGFIWRVKDKSGSWSAR
ncbi:hypothetical protein KF913_16830 [Candidatus Obscuribacterales bacterium]|nr:hypothetical protein [Candidatus Obscuribacterales bacterium]